MDKVSQNVIEIADRYFTMARESCNAWIEKAKENPFYAFEWSEKARASAAEAEVTAIIIDQLESGDSPESVMEHLREVAMRAGRFPKRSTDVLANEMALLKAAAQIEWADKIESAIARHLAGKE